MSLLTLLVDFPNYSARKVRRLAKQIALVEELQGAKELGPETGTLKGIASDLMEFNLQQARTEAQMNDDTPTPVEEWWGRSQPPTSVESATSEIAEMRADWMALTRACGFETFTDPDVIIEEVKRLHALSVRKTENVVVTPVSEAMRAIEELIEKFMSRMDANVLDEEWMRPVRQRAKGIVSGSAFTVSREIPQ